MPAYSCLFSWCFGSLQGTSMFFIDFRRFTLQQMQFCHFWLIFSWIVVKHHREGLHSPNREGLCSEHLLPKAYVRVGLSHFNDCLALQSVVLSIFRHENGRVHVRGSIQCFTTRRHCKMSAVRIFGALFTFSRSGFGDENSNHRSSVSRTKWNLFLFLNFLVYLVEYF